MGNHFHLVVETPRANLVAGMKWLLGTYTGRFNRLPVRAARRQAGTTSLGTCSDDDDAGVDCGALADGEREHVEEHAAFVRD